MTGDSVTVCSQHLPELVLNACAARHVRGSSSSAAYLASGERVSLPLPSADPSSPDSLFRAHYDRLAQSLALISGGDKEAAAHAGRNNTRGLRLPYTPLRIISST